MDLSIRRLHDPVRKIDSKVSSMISEKDLLENTGLPQFSPLYVYCIPLLPSCVLFGLAPLCRQKLGSTVLLLLSLVELRFHAGGGNTTIIHTIGVTCDWKSSGSKIFCADD